jgi:hypothetical protein
MAMTVNVDGKATAPSERMPEVEGLEAVTAPLVLSAEGDKPNPNPNPK